MNVYRDVMQAGKAISGAQTFIGYPVPCHTTAIRGRTPVNTVLFVCTGNTCRSPMAEAIARSISDEREFFFASAGIAASDGARPSRETMQVLADRSIEHEGRSTPLSAEMLRKADLVLCMTSSHLAAARAMVADEPGCEDRIQLLDPDGDIPDPIGQGQDRYEAVATRLAELIPTRISSLLANQ